MDERSQPRLRQADRSRVIHQTTLDQLVGPDHPVRAIWDYVCALDLTALLSAIKAVEGRPGRDATDPRILLALWMWAVCDGIGTARVLERLCREHAAYRWLAGGVSLNYHLLSDFRSDHERELDRFFESHISALLQQGVIELACVAQDGMRTRASAGAGSFHRAASIEQCRDLVREQLAALERQEAEPRDAVARRQRTAQERRAQDRAQRLEAALEVARELDAKRAERIRLHPKEAQLRRTAEHPARASTTDVECRRIKFADGGTRPGYNVQCATAVGSGIIVDLDVTNQGSDGGLLGPMIGAIKRRYGRVPGSVLVDGGYSSREDVEDAHRRGVAVYTTLKNERRELEAGTDPYAPKAGDGAGMKALRARMGTEAGKEVYKQRGPTAEWVNAGMRQRGLYQVSVRGVAKVRAVVLLQALVHNLWQTVRLMTARGRPWNWAETLRAERRAPRSPAR
jgi:transposase